MPRRSPRRYPQYVRGARLFGLGPHLAGFIVDTTLCIPTVFIAYTGEALDYKVPLLRSLAAVDRLPRRSAATSTRTCSGLRLPGWEQEYFLVDESLWAVRPDLVLTGRTLMGTSRPRTSSLRTTTSVRSPRA